jgi:hypothetical protein
MRRKFFGCILALLVCGFLLWSIADFWAKSKLEQACADWPLIDRNLVDLIQVVPRTSSNQAAQDLKALYERTRFDVGQDGQAPSEPDSNAVGDMRSLLRDYLEREYGRAGALLEPPPAHIVTMLTYNKEVLDEITSQLLNNELPQSALNVEADPVGRVPNLLWSIQLSRLLVVQALSLQTEGKSEQAWSSLHAVARLADSSFSQPSLILQLIGIAEANWVPLTMRKMPAPIPPWALKWPTHDLERGMLMSYIAEARRTLRIEETGQLLPLIRETNSINREIGREEDLFDIGIGTRILASVVGRPYVRAGIAHMLEAYKASIMERMEESLCSVQPKNHPPVNDRLPGWVASGMLGTLTSESSGGFFNASWKRAHRIMVLLTGTRSILAAKAESPSHRWPESLAGIASLPCGNLAWSYTLAPDGAATFQYPHPLPSDLYPEVPAEHLTYSGSVNE